MKAISKSEKYCEVCKKCSGCQLSNLDYGSQLRYKQNQIRLRFLSLCKPSRIIGAESPLHYRNKAQFVFRRIKGKIRAGIYQSADRTMVATDNCPLHTPEQNQVAVTLAKLFESFKAEPYDPYKGRGVIKSVFVRQSFDTKEMMVVIVCNHGSHFKSPEKLANALVKRIPTVKSVILTTHKGNTLTQGDNPEVLFGDDHISEILCGMDFIIGYNSFFQINPAQTEILYRTAVSMAELKSTDTVLDAYSGTGTIGMICSDKVKKVYSVELNENAVKDARQNIKNNCIENIESICADSEEFIKELAQSGEPVTCALLDPPRAGCSRSFLSTLCHLAPERIVYISCNIDTQVRDIRFLIKQGYKLKKVQGVDMFPYTKHIESIAYLTRNCEDTL